jgi:ribonuclease T2
VRRILRAALLACLLCPPAQAHRHRPAGDESGAAGRFDYYLLSLSWSPAYCLTHEQDRRQCGSRGLGFVLHGLWPQFESGRYPQYCGTGSVLDDRARRLADTLYPSPALVRHEWTAHGTCSGLDPYDYFTSADHAVAQVRLPADFEAPRRDLRLTSQQIIAAFRQANPAWPEDSIRLECRRARLAEVRICLTRELSVRACGGALRGNCPDAPLLILSSR